MNKTVKAILYAVGLPIILLVFWYIATLNNTSPFVPKPIPLVDTFVKTWIGPTFFQHVVPSLLRLAVGLTGAIIIGILIGVLVGSFRTLRDLFEPLLEFFRAIPPPVLVPVLLLLIGIGDNMKVTVIVIGCMWPILLNTVDGVRSTDPVLSETAKSYGMHGLARLRYLTLPGAAPRIMAGVRQSLSIGLILVVISEMFAASSGLGYQIVVFQRTFRIPEMWSGIVLLGLIGLLLAFLFRQVESVVLRWYFGLREVELRGN